MKSFDWNLIIGMIELLMVMGLISGITAAGVAVSAVLIGASFIWALILFIMLFLIFSSSILLIALS